MNVASALLAVLSLTSSSPGTGEGTAALVVMANGRLVHQAAGGERRDLRAFDAVAAGGLLESAEDGAAVLALANGRRYELGPRARVRVGTDAIEILVGSCRELARVAALPRLSALSPDAHPGSRSGALRIRGQRIRELYPAGGATVPADSTTLRFSPVPGIDRYVLEIEDEQGESVFRAQSETSELLVPAGVLRPGGRYRWLVKGASAQGPARGEAEFSTLGAEEAADRRALRESLEGAEDAGSLALLAEVDRRLGLLREAREQFARALEASPGDEALRAAVEGLDERLREPQPAE
jgi:hypothetical protein